MLRKLLFKKKNPKCFCFGKMHPRATFMFSVERHNSLISDDQIISLTITKIGSFRLVKLINEQIRQEISKDHSIKKFNNLR